MEESSNLLVKDCYTSTKYIPQDIHPFAEHILRDRTDHFNEIRTANVSEMNSNSALKSVTGTGGIFTGRTLRQVMYNSDQTNFRVDQSGCENGNILATTGISNFTGFFQYQSDYTNHEQEIFSKRDSRGNKLERLEEIISKYSLNETFDKVRNAEENLRADIPSTSNPSQIQFLHSNVHTKCYSSNNAMEVCEKPKQAVNLPLPTADKFNRYQQSNYAIDNKDGEWSDFCLKFGHSAVCPYGENCKFKGKDKCDFCDLYCIPRLDLQGKYKHENICLRESARKKTNTFREEKETVFCSKTCNLCNSVISRKSPDLHKRFYGIMPKCDHVFCLDCAEECRTDLAGENRKNIIICRICKIYSTCYAVSARWITEEHKSKFLWNYFESVKGLKCEFCTVNSKSEITAGTNICYHGRAIIPNNYYPTNL